MPGEGCCGSSGQMEKRPKESVLLDYIETIPIDFDSSGRHRRRVDCCGSSRSLFCPECFQILIPPEAWPYSIRCSCRHEKLQQRLELPFSVDVILGWKERRTSSTGVHFMTICKMMQQMHDDQQHQHQNCTNDGKGDDDDACNPNPTRLQQRREEENESDDGYTGGENLDRSSVASLHHQMRQASCSWWKDSRLFDLNQISTMIPQYPKHHDDDDNNDVVSSEGCDDGDGGGVFVLFPSFSGEKQSIPISSVAHKIRKLIVLDCKWSTTGGVKGRSKLSTKRAHGDKINENDNNCCDKLQSATTITSSIGSTTTDEECEVCSPQDESRSKPCFVSWEELPFVHLEDPPKHSLFWRWHHCGDGMLSTIEAIYFAALEVDDAITSSREMSRSRRSRRESMIDIMWLFALQRRLILHDRKHNIAAAVHVGDAAAAAATTLLEGKGKSSSNEIKNNKNVSSKLLPFTPEAKEHRMKLRHRKDGKDASARQKREEKHSKKNQMYSQLSGD
jgi:hypothetical protein